MVSFDKSGIQIENQYDPKKEVIEMNKTKKLTVREQYNQNAKEAVKKGYIDVSGYTF